LENEDFVARINDGRWDYCESLISGTFRGHRGQKDSGLLSLQISKHQLSNNSWFKSREVGHLIVDVSYGIYGLCCESVEK
jgi:hypothetical protein